MISTYVGHIIAMGFFQNVVNVNGWYGKEKYNFLNKWTDVNFFMYLEGKNPLK